MKKIIVALIVILCPALFCYGRSMDDQERVHINVVTPDTKNIPQEAADYLADKMRQLVASNGMVDYGYAGRFVLTAKVNVLSKDIAPTTPVRISQNLEVVFMVGDVMDNKLFETVSLSVSGIGTTETKAFIAAFRNIREKNKYLVDLLSRAKEEIVNYYTDNCDALIAQAQTLASMQQYDKAIYTLITVPDVCQSCYLRCQKAVAPIYTKKINEEGEALFSKAKAEWAQSPNAEGASRAISLTSAINQRSACYSQVAAFHETIGKKLRDDEKREWEFRMQQYEDKRKFKQSIVDACKAVGVAFGQGQPQSITKNIISRW